MTIFALLACTAVLAKPSSQQVMPQLVADARYVYVTTYDGPPERSNVLSEDRQAVSDVQDAIRKWGKYAVVYHPEEADLILVVQRRGSEDILAVYQARPVSSSFLWRGMSQGGLDPQELPLFSDFRRAVEQTAARN
jgi:hypothetical protein